MRRPRSDRPRPGSDRSRASTDGSRDLWAVSGRRVGFLFTALLVALAALWLRGGYLQIVDAGRLHDEALGQQVTVREVPAERGPIVDRHGIALAVSTRAATVVGDPRQIRDPDAVARKLAPLVERPVGELASKLRRQDTGFVYLARRIDRRAGERVDGLDLAGIDVLPEQKRVYPYGSMAGQVLGIVGSDGRGLAGLEGAHEERLRGRAGENRIVRDGRASARDVIPTRRALPGRGVALTLDTAIQQETETALAEIARSHSPKGVQAIVMDVRSGEVLAMANWPSVDPNAVERVDQERLRNRAVTDVYEPGSTFKPVTFAAALEERAVSPDTSLTLGSTFQACDRTIENAEEGGAGVLTPLEILAESSNVGTVTVASKLGGDRFGRWVRRFGFGTRTGIDFPGEVGGIVLPARDYSCASMANLPIGQGIGVTSVQMVSAFATIANSGVSVTPRLVKEPGRTPAARTGRRVISARTVAELVPMMTAVTEAGGTGIEAAIPGVAVAGKTGTAQKAAPGGGGYETGRYVASFVGFAPAEAPTLAALVTVDEPQGAIYGGAVAAPAFARIMSYALSRTRGEGRRARGAISDSSR